MNANETSLPATLRGVGARERDNDGLPFGRGFPREAGSGSSAEDDTQSEANFSLPPDPFIPEISVKGTNWLPRKASAAF
jgi:hypothetical protein